MKFFHISLLLIFSTTLQSCIGQVKKSDENPHEFTNDLIHETSPYLLQHAHNPVDWQPWGEKAFAQAKKENKLVIISIGYAACHWCHVMEHESFEDTTVAKLMNDNFVCIKVDREERPDVDQIYMKACQMITGSGGWPLNSLALPDGKPFFAGTYFPKDDWVKMLNYFVDFKKNKPEKLVEQAEAVTEAIRKNQVIAPAKSSPSTFAQLDARFDDWQKDIDFKKGGNRGAPKFPMPNNWEYLIQYSNISKNQKALDAVNSTLNNLADGGIYDQIGGGFSRYSTDSGWRVPHFEKMTYDNAQLVSLFSHAFHKTKNPKYETVVRETLDFVSREMTSPEGAFYSSLDADSDGEEGKFYVWTFDEINSVLGNDALLFNDYYNVSKSGNWEKKKNILLIDESDSAFAKAHKISASELQTTINRDKKLLLAARSKRIRPRLDDKILTSWNALMAKGYINAYLALGDEEFLQKAIKNANFIHDKMMADDELLRNYKDGKANIHGLLDDYAFTISMYTDLYQATFDEKWILRAKELVDYTIAHFEDKNTGMFFYTNDQYSNLIARQFEIDDNVIPSSNSEMARNLYTLGLYYDNADYDKKAKQMLANVQKNLEKNTRFFSNWAILELDILSPPYEIAIVGKDAQKLRAEFEKNYLPNAIFLGGKDEGTLPLLEGKLSAGETTIYVCRDKVCKLPTNSVAEALKQMK